MFIRIGSILKSTHARSRQGDAFVALSVRQAAKEVLDKACKDYPEDITKSVKVKTFKNGTLIIHSPQLLSTELYTRSEGLRKDINDVLKKNLVAKIRFRAG